VTNVKRKKLKYCIIPSFLADVLSRQKLLNHNKLSIVLQFGSAASIVISFVISILIVTAISWFNVCFYLLLVPSFQFQRIVENK